MLGESDIEVSYHNKSFIHTFFVVNNNNVNLLGRDLCSKLDVKLLFPDNINNCGNDFLYEYKDYLSDSYRSNVTKTVHLDVYKDVTPIYSKCRQVPIKLKEKLDCELQRLVAEGKISKIFKSKWASPVVTVFKQNGDIRLCCDFSGTVNKYLDPVQTPLPTVDDTIARIGKASVFSKIDLSQAFLQLPLDEYSKQFTVINTPSGLFQYNFLPFGLTASSGIFQAFLTETLSGIDNLIIYQDDVLILSEDHNSHIITLKKVLNTLKDHGIKINSGKCKFLCKSVDYLGHVFDCSGVYPNPNKIKSILEAPPPKTTKQVQSFLGLCNYYSRFIPKFTDTLAPLYALLKNESKFQWSDSQQNAFNKIKNMFKCHGILQHYDPNYELKLETDSSSYGLGAVLLTRPDSNSSWLPIQFASRTLNSAEQNYSNIEREALSVIFGLEKFRNYLLGSKFIICNDQKPLLKLFAKDKPIPNSCSSRIQRWALKLSQYNYSFVYSRGKDNVHSDCLSRLPLPNTVMEAEPYEIVSTCQVLNSNFVTCVDIKVHTDNDPDLVLLKSFIKTGCPDRISNPKLSKIKSIIPNLSIVKGCIMYQNRVFIPVSLRSKVLNLFHQNHPGIVAMKSLARSVIWYPGMDNEIQSMVSNCKLCQSVRSKPPQNNITWPTPARSWSRIHIDHFFVENSICLIVVDALTKYIEVEIVSSTSSNVTIDILVNIFARNGLPDVLVSDNASSFTSSEFSSFLSRNGISHLTPPPYSPASNGQAERGVRVIKDMLKKVSSNNSLKYKIGQVLLQYRSIPHSVTHIAPSVALNKRKLITLRDKINPLFHSESLKDKVIRHFDIGSSVLALNLREGKKWYNATVTEVLGINIYNVLVHDLNVTWKRHSNQLISIPDSHNIQLDNRCEIQDPVSSHDHVSNKQAYPVRNRQAPDRLTYY